MAANPESPTVPQLRVLVVEDEMMVVMMLEEFLKILGCTTVKAPRVGKALKIIAETEFDVALLDVNVAGETVYPVAEALDQRGIPFVFVTGYAPLALREDYRDRPALTKPFSAATLGEVLAGIAFPRG